MKRLLLVDDEEPALDALRFCLMRGSRKWLVDGATSGRGAIEQMERQPYDVIVTDMRMPGMDGAELLGITADRWPQTIRIVLSGYADMRQTIRLVPFAHQYLSKPCDPGHLQEIIDRCLLLHELLNGAALRTLVGRIRRLPARPRIYAALQELVRSDDSTVQDVARLVASDSAIAAKVLQIVNSAFFRLARRITNIEQAVSYLGFTAIRNIATSAEIFSQWDHAGASPFDPEKLQAHVQAVATAARALTAKTPIADDTLLAGLLHDIGYWVLAYECPTELNNALQLATQTHIPLHEAESQIMGASHAEIGAYLLGIWGFPYPIIEAVAHHHRPERVVQTQFDVLGALVIADDLVEIHDCQLAGIEPAPNERRGPDYLHAIKAPFDLDEARRRVADTA